MYFFYDNIIISLIDYCTIANGYSKARKLIIKTTKQYPDLINKLNLDPLIEKVDTENHTIFTCIFNGDEYDCAEMLNNLVNAGIMICEFTEEQKSMHSFYLERIQSNIKSQKHSNEQSSQDKVD